VSKYLTINEVAKRCGVTTTCVVQWITRGRTSAGRLTAYEQDRGRQASGNWVVNEKDLEEYLGKLNVQGRPSKLSDGDIREIRRLRMSGLEYSEIGKRFGIDTSYVGLITSGKRRPGAGGPIAGRDYG